MAKPASVLIKMVSTPIPVTSTLRRTPVLPLKSWKCANTIPLPKYAVFKEFEDEISLSNNQKTEKAALKRQPPFFFSHPAAT